MTENLQKEIVALKADLGHTRKALDSPKAEMVASLGKVGFNLENIERKDTYVERRADGTVEFELAVMNTSRVQARDGTVFVRVCASCEFAQEPQGFHRVERAPSKDRLRSFDRVEPHFGLSILLRIRPPEGSHQFQMIVTTTCGNCMFRPQDVLYVHY
jgi:hypothetical protein